MTEIVRVEKKLRDSQPWCTPIFRFGETFSVETPRGKRLSAAEAG